MYAHFVNYIGLITQKRVPAFVAFVPACSSFIMNKIKHKSLKKSLFLNNDHVPTGLAYDNIILL